MVVMSVDLQLCYLVSAATDMIRNDKIVELLEERKRKDIRKLNEVGIVS